MGFRRQMLNMMLQGKSPEDIVALMGEMMPLMMEKMGSEGMARMMGEMMSQMMENMGPEGMARMMENMMPLMMDTCFSGMDTEQRRFMLSYCRSIIDSMEEKYLA